MILQSLEGAKFVHHQETEKAKQVKQNEAHSHVC